MKYISKAKLFNAMLVVIIMAMSVVSVIGCGTSGPIISQDQAIDVLTSEIMEPAADSNGISAFMLSQPLKKGDSVVSESGQTYQIDKDTYFIFIDDDPTAFYAHDCRYVLIDAKTGSYEVIDETWPPEINDHSMWDTQALGRGDIIAFYSVLDPASPVVGSASQAPDGDYGDAPDGQYDDLGKLGRYPTLFNTSSSHFGRPGGHTLNVGQETLGVDVSAEVDANDPADPDGAPNLVDADSDERIFIAVDGTRAKLVITVTVAPNAPNVSRYLNAVIDFDQNGKWSAGSCGTEWVVVNQLVDVAPGSSETVTTSWFSWGNENEPTSPVWMRVLLARDQVDESLFADVGGWDGSGEFQYGEVEDYLVSLAHELEPVPTPTPAGGAHSGDGGQGGGQGGGAQSPGPDTDPCGDKLNYYVITISGGDLAEHITGGTPIVNASTGMMAGLASEQGYISMGNLGPGSNSIDNIRQAFNQLATRVNCRDQVLIYICGHGLKDGDGGITLRDSSGKKQGILKPEDLAGLLSIIPPCEEPDNYCDQPGTCCHVTVIIESCYAGKFNTPGVTGVGRTIIGTSGTTKSQATYPGGGVYTQGFNEASRGSASQAAKDGAVNPKEATQAASDAVNASMSNQRVWTDSQECECICKAGINVSKWVWSDSYHDWVNEITAGVGQEVRFKLDIENSGEGELTSLLVTDILPACFEYAGGATAVLDGIYKKNYAPDGISGVGATGAEIYWDVVEIESLAPGGKITIEFDATALTEGTCVNEVEATAHSADSESAVVSDHDDAVVKVASQIPDYYLPTETPEIWVQPGETPVSEGTPRTETVLYGYLSLNQQCTYMNDRCVSCTVTADFYGQDLTAGEYPVTSVVLTANGQTVYDSGSISASLHQNQITFSATCGTTYNMQLTVTNSIGLQAVVTKSFTAGASE